MLETLMADALASLPDQTDRGDVLEPFLLLHDGRRQCRFPMPQLLSDDLKAMVLARLIPDDIIDSEARAALLVFQVKASSSPWPPLERIVMVGVTACGVGISNAAEIDHETGSGVRSWSRIEVPAEQLPGRIDASLRTGFELLAAGAAPQEAILDDELWSEPVVL